MIVLLIVAFIALAAMPSGEGRMDQAYVAESLALATPYKLQIAEYQMQTGEFPTDNEALGLPMPDELQGNYLSSMTIDHGALHLELGNKIRPELRGKVVTIRPIFTPGVENGPISWVCGHSAVPGEMVAAGPNLTNLDPHRLPVQCR